MKLSEQYRELALIVVEVREGRRSGVLMAGVRKKTESEWMATGIGK